MNALESTLAVLLALSLLGNLLERRRLLTVRKRDAQVSLAAATQDSDLATARHQNDNLRRSLEVSDALASALDSQLRTSATNLQEMERAYQASQADNTKLVAENNDLSAEVSRLKASHDKPKRKR